MNDKPLNISDIPERSLVMAILPTCEFCFDPTKVLILTPNNVTKDADSLVWHLCRSCSEEYDKKKTDRAFARNYIGVNGQ